MPLNAEGAAEGARGAGGADDRSVLLEPPGDEHDPVDPKTSPPFRIRKLVLVGSDDVFWVRVPVAGPCRHDDIAFYAQGLQ